MSEIKHEDPLARLEGRKSSEVTKISNPKCYHSHKKQKYWLTATNCQDIMSHKNNYTYTVPVKSCFFFHFHIQGNEQVCTSWYCIHSKNKNKTNVSGLKRSK